MEKNAPEACVQFDNYCEYEEFCEENRASLRELEQEWMILKDQYSEVARALGFEGDGWFNDPLVSHEVIVERAKELKEKAWRYDDLCK